MLLLTTVLSALLALAMTQTAVRKAVHTSDSDALRDQLEVPNPLWQTIGALEGAAAAGLVAGVWWEPIGVAAATGVVLTMIGAVVAHLRLGIAGAGLVPPVVLGVFAAAVAVLVGQR
jgi:hypothetical protein